MASSFVTKPVLDEKGNLKITSPSFGVSLALVKAGETKDERGRSLKWDDGIKVSVPTVGDKIGVIKLTALQAAFLRDAFNVPEIAAELKKRIEAEKSVLMATMGGI